MLRSPTLKRLFDIIVAALMLVALSPVLVVVAMLVRLCLGSPVLFSQERPGLNGKIFRLYKFRTMLNATSQDGRTLSDAERLTRFGKLLRASSLDELPELFNVLRGDMSLVGPRPLLVSYLSLYSPRQARRHDVRPGITGWAQINGRNTVDWANRFELDVWYVENWNLWLDLKIMVLTVWKTIKSEGVNQEGQATMQEFKG